MKIRTKLLVTVPFLCISLQPVYAADEVELTPAHETAATSDNAVDAAMAQSVEEKTTPAKVLHNSSKSSSKHKAAAKWHEEAGDTIASSEVDSNYTIHPGDVLQITVWKEDTLDREILVLPDGTIDFPLIGSFKASGMTPAKVQNTIKAKLHTLIPDASVTVVVKATLGHSVSVIGQVAKPGELVMSHRLTVMQALSQAGGLTPYASEDRIIILRNTDGKETSIAFPYSDVISGHHLDQDIMLNPGDVIVVPSASLF